MIAFGKHYFYHDGEIYVKLKPSTQRSQKRWKLQDKTGKQHWVSESQLKKIIDKIAKRAI